MIALLAICRSNCVGVFFDKEALVDYLCCLGYWSVALFIGAHIVATAIGVPGTLLVVVGGDDIWPLLGNDLVCDWGDSGGDRSLLDLPLLVKRLV